MVLSESTINLVLPLTMLIRLLRRMQRSLRLVVVVLNGLVRTGLLKWAYLLRWNVVPLLNDTPVLRVYSDPDVLLLGLLTPVSGPTLISAVLPLPKYRYTCSRTPVVRLRLVRQKLTRLVTCPVVLTLKLLRVPTRRCPIDLGRLPVTLLILALLPVAVRILKLCDAWLMDTDMQHLRRTPPVLVMSILPIPRLRTATGRTDLDSSTVLLWPRVTPMLFVRL